MNPADRRRVHGEIRDYLPNRHRGGHPVGLPTDDTQLAAWLLESLLEQRGLQVADVAKRFAIQRIFGMGATVRGFLRDYHSGKDLWACGQQSAGNGALMRGRRSARIPPASLASRGARRCATLLGPDAQRSDVKRELRRVQREAL